VTDQPPLADKMRALAKGHPRGAELVEKADAFEKATAELYAPATVDTKAAAKRMLGTWARARKLWCELTGEPLV
jgi:hypothetical protein